MVKREKKLMFFHIPHNIERIKEKPPSETDGREFFRVKATTTDRRGGWNEKVENLIEKLLCPCGNKKKVE